MSECERDPNLRTNASAESEYERIVKLKDYRRLFADTLVQTTEMLKKQVAIPIKYEEDVPAD